MKVSEGKLINIVESIAKVPEVNIPTKVVKPNALHTELVELELLSPEVFVKFYLHLEETQAINPNKTIKFINGDRRFSYQAIINQLEQGSYVPMGETDDVIDQLKGIDDVQSLSYSQFTTIIARTKHVVWDHDHFR